MSTLLVHSDDPTEAAHSVAAVCRFMAAAMDRTNVGDADIADGARVILETCATTLEHHFVKIPE